MSTPRWFTETKDGHSEWYIERFRSMARDGADLFGEARLVDAMVSRRSRILDAGCGPGRVGGYLYSVGHDVTGVDVDPKLIAAAHVDYPGPRWLVGDLAQLDLPGEKFDSIVCAGNVMAFLAPGTEPAVLERFRDHLMPDGFVAVGFHTNRGLSPEAFDGYAARADLRTDLRLATWDVKPWHDGADFAVSILRHA